LVLAVAEALNTATILMLTEHIKKCIAHSVVAAPEKLSVELFYKRAINGSYDYRGAIGMFALKIARISSKR
jgi:hypothetical protein